LQFQAALWAEAQVGVRLAAGLQVSIGIKLNGT
jgi:hypothetical protein